MKKYVLILAAVVALVSCTKRGFDLESDRSSLAIENHLSLNGYDIYKTIIDGDTSYYCNSSVLLGFLSVVGEQSGNIFDLNQDGIANSSDQLILFQGYGITPPHNWDLYECEIFGQFSSGWFMQHPEWDAIFLKPTPVDELDNDYTPDELQSFVLEGSIDGSSYRVWYYRK